MFVGKISSQYIQNMTRWGSWYILWCNGLITYWQVFQAVGQGAVMLTSSGFFAISYPFLAALLYIVQRFYLRTSRQLRLLDLEAKSPL